MADRHEQFAAEVPADSLIEVHDRQIKALAEPTETLRQRLKALGVEHFRLDWR